jgi:hypothetical protein
MNLVKEPPPETREAKQARMAEANKKLLAAAAAAA